MLYIHPRFPALFLLLLMALPCLSQQREKAPSCRAVVITTSGKIKGVLYRVTDSSVVLQLRRSGPKEILYSDINKIRLRNIAWVNATTAVGALAGGITGATLLVNAWTKGRTGEGSVYAGLAGGGLGFLGGAVVGLIVSPAIYKWIFSKRFTVIHDPASYSVLTANLRRYCRRKD